MADAKIGTLSIDKAYIGSDEVQKMYLGETEVWSATPPGPATVTLKWGIAQGSKGVSFTLYDVTDSQTLFTTTTKFAEQVVEIELKYGHTYYVEESSYSRTDTLPYQYTYYEIGEAVIAGTSCAYRDGTTPYEISTSSLDITIEVSEIAGWTAQIHRKIYFTLTKS